MPFLINAKLMHPEKRCWRSITPLRVTVIEKVYIPRWLLIRQPKHGRVTLDQLALTVPVVTYARVAEPRGRARYATLKVRPDDRHPDRIDTEILVSHLFYHFALDFGSPPKTVASRGRE